MALLLNQGDVVLRSYSYTKPSPTHPITPEMCGVLNENLSIIDTDSYSLNDWYYKDTRLTDLLPPGTYTISFVTDSITSGTTTDGTIGIGTTSDYTEDLEWFTRAAVGSMTTVTVTLSESKCLWARLVRDHNIVKITCSISVSKIRVEEGSTAYGWKVPFENHGENLFDGVIGTDNVILSENGNSNPNNAYALSKYIPVEPNTSYIYHFYHNIAENRSTYSISEYDRNQNVITPLTLQWITEKGDYAINFTTQTNTAFIRINWKKAPDENLMLNLGSTPKPYSPYLNETIPVYLGEVPTVRRVKKLVLDGTETLHYNVSNNAGYVAINDGMQETISPYCDILQGTTLPASDAPNNSVKQLKVNSLEGFVCGLLVKSSGFNNLTSFQQWLADNMPTVWYVLATPETTISNEPLCKISTYADELTTIQVHGLSAPLYGIGDYKDTLNLSTGIVTRKVKKLVLSGAENWIYRSGEPQNVYFIELAGVHVVNNAGLCTHYPNQDSESFSAMLDKHLLIRFANDGTKSYIGIRDSSFATLADLQIYLAKQYANGTPVTVWYALNTPETETVTVPTGMTGEIEGYLTQVSTPTPTNRSVPKWNGVEETGGTYAVTVYTPPEIPTTTGQNTLTVETDLAPYEVTVEGHIKYGYWGKIREDVRSGVAQTKFPVGTIFYDNGDETTGTAFQVVGYDKHFDPEMTARGYTHSMTLCELKLTDLVTFDATEALLYVETAIAPGTYRFKIPNYDATYGGNKSYYFTTTKSIPVGGQITINWPYQQTPKTASTYSEIAGVTAIESGLTLSEWIEGDSPAAIDLGTAAGPNAELGTSSFGKMNHIHRARYGSNNYLQSGIRQYINSDKAANSWWSPQTVFDRPYGSRTSAGKLTKLSSEFVDALVKPAIKSRTNNYFETDSLDGTEFSVSADYTITTDKMFLLSPNEVGLNADTTIGATLDYYLNATDTDRIKYRASNDAAYYWWLRTPHPASASSVRNVYASGALSRNSALSTYGVAAACVIQ